MKKCIALATCATLALSTPALADTNDFVITHHELAFAFDDVQNLQATAMTDAEMADTQGAWANFAVGAGIGAVGGHFSYMSGAIANDSYNWKAHVTAVGVGAGTGLLNPVSRATHLINGMKGVVTATVGSGAVGYAGRN